MYAIMKVLKASAARAPRRRPLAFQVLRKPCLAPLRDVAPGGELRAEGGAHDRPRPQDAGQLLLQRLVQMDAQGLQVRQRGEEAGERLREGEGTQARKQAQRIPDRGEVSRRPRPQGEPGQGAL